MNRDSKYCAAFRLILKSPGTHVIRLAPGSPDLDGCVERFVRSVKEEYLPNLMLIDASNLHSLPTKYLDHYHEECDHQGKGNALLFAPGKPKEESPTECRKRLG